MVYILNVLSGLVSVYTLLIFIRILLTWFPGIDFGRVHTFLCALCDPYLNWFRRFRLFKNSPIDFSPLLALAALSLLQALLGVWKSPGGISILALVGLVLSLVWSIISWILGFFIIVLVLRLICYLAGFNIYSPFWRLVDYIAQPVMYRIGRIFFPSRIVNYVFRLVFSIVVLLILAALLWFVFKVLL